MDMNLYKSVIQTMCLIHLILPVVSKICILKQ